MMKQPHEEGDPGQTDPARQGGDAKVWATSALLLWIAQSGSAPRVSLGDVLTHLGDRSFGLLLVLLGLGGWVPVWPIGVATIFGVAIALVALQMVFGRPRPWLPAVLTRRSIRRERLLAVAQRVAPLLRRCELLAKPRLPALTNKGSERLLGLYILVLALFVCVPLPMTNAGPALAVAVIAAGMIEKDGLFVAAGVVFGVLAVVFMVVFWGGAYLGALSLFGS